jgi:hypothetical protein
MTTFRFSIVAGEPKDVEKFIDETLDVGAVWWGVSDDYVLRAPNFPFSGKFEEDEYANEVRQLALRHNVVLFTFTSRCPLMPKFNTTIDLETPAGGLLEMDVTIEATWCPPSGDGWNEPREPGHYEVDAYYVTALTWYHPDDDHTTLQVQAGSVLALMGESYLDRNPELLDEAVSDWQCDEEYNLCQEHRRN